MFCALACVACLCRVAPGSTLQLVTSALSFLLAVKECSEHSLASWETWALLERGLNSLKPKFEENSECVVVRGVAPSCARSLCPVFSHIQVVSSAGDSRVRAPPLLGGIVIERGTRSKAQWNVRVVKIVIVLSNIDASIAA